LDREAVNVKSWIIIEPFAKEFMNSLANGSIFIHYNIILGDQLD